MTTDFVLNALDQISTPVSPQTPMSCFTHSTEARNRYRSGAPNACPKPASPPSVGSRGDALAETINGLYTAEVIHRRSPRESREAVELATLEWAACHNHERLMQTLT
jgi:hypothetical protein